MLPSGPESAVFPKPRVFTRVSSKSKIIHQILTHHEGAGFAQNPLLIGVALFPRGNHDHGQPELLALQKLSRRVQIFLILQFGGIRFVKQVFRAVVEALDGRGLWEAAEVVLL